MALDTTVGGTAANAFCDQAWADAYILNRGAAALNADWTSATVADKEQCIQWATRKLDEFEWKGLRKTQTQALRWPRVGLTDRDGFYIDSASIPVWLKNAAAEYALWLFRGDRTADAGSITFQEQKVGSIQTKNLQYRPVPASVLDMVRPYLKNAPGGLSVSLVRS